MSRGGGGCYLFLDLFLEYDFLVDEAEEAFFDVEGEGRFFVWAFLFVATAVEVAVRFDAEGGCLIFAAACLFMPNSTLSLRDVRLTVSLIFCIRVSVAFSNSSRFG